MRWKKAQLMALSALAIALVAAHACPGYAIEAVSGASCEGSVCVDDASLAPDARQLYVEALTFVRTNVAPIKSEPFTVFCSSRRCFSAFGFSAGSAKSVGNAIIVLGPNAWKPFYVRHELIHQAQAHQLGSLKMMTQPVWFVEGMAYSLSGDPRRPLAEPFEGYRARFDAWHRSIGDADFWVEARKL